MAAQIGSNEALYQRESHAALQRLGFKPNYPNVTWLTQFASPGRGQGLRADRYIPRGTPILSERNLFCVVAGRQPTPTQARKAGFQALSCPLAPSTTTRFDANSFQMGNDSRGREKRGIFLQASRFNHSCIPNAHFAWNWRSKILTVHAILNIERNEEIFLNYSTDDFLKTTLQRQAGLRSYSFRCTCPACQPNTAVGMESQQRRTKMRTLDNRIENNTNTTQRAQRNQLLADIQAFSLLLQQEGLFYPQLADSFGEQVSWYRTEMEYVANGAESAAYKAGLRGKALEAARAKLDWDVVCTGYDSPEFKKTMKVICELGQA